MKIIIFLTLASSMSFASNPFALKKKACIDPRVEIVECAEGTTFTGWNVGSCQKGLVEGPICAQDCFDPRLALVECAEGATFSGWNVGTCEKGLVQGPICVK